MVLYDNLIKMLKNNYFFIFSRDAKSCRWVSEWHWHPWRVVDKLENSYREIKYLDMNVLLVQICFDLCIMHTLLVKHAIKIISQAIKGHDLRSKLHYLSQLSLLRILLNNTFYCWHSIVWRHGTSSTWSWSTRSVYSLPSYCASKTRSYPLWCNNMFIN